MKISVRNFCYVILFVIMAVPVAYEVRAQDGDPSRTVDENLLDGSTEIIDTFVTAMEDEYVLPDVQNLSKLYWAIGKLDIDNPKLIDYYLMINECDMYLQFYHNDFEWGNIQAATKQYILDNMESFPTTFEIMSPIGLGRYDIDREEFEILEQDRLIGLRRLDFAMNYEAYKETCAKTGEIYEYPANVIIILSRPLSLETVPVKKELAKLYIEEAKMFYETLPPVLQMRNYERMAFLRLKVRITQYKNTVRVVNGDLRAVVFGRLDGIEVFADPHKLKPLYFRDLRDKRFKRLRRKEDNAQAEDADPNIQSDMDFIADQIVTQQDQQ